jgi:hypothetical protein
LAVDLLALALAGITWDANSAGGFHLESKSHAGLCFRADLEALAVGFEGVSVGNGFDLDFLGFNTMLFGQLNVRLAFILDLYLGTGSCDPVCGLGVGIVVAFLSLLLSEQPGVVL